ncbi:DUF7551 domain-containing protein [Halobiforma nitratireducens]|uniref:Uncharacterized protein n=1 Tax=Halobiforma nitratireducens JCM 10879 TaxID=1227454 RepID=M0LCL6_9EURY|nr:hypothetical protein [Halobiforma nitratireducens]EMA31326.1 hypothetical protein C446_15830 [Halobiforma nitratireducens JCM 10879]
MVGTTLGDIRRYLESLSSETGRYHLVCARTGEQPVPAVGLVFDDRPTARAAVRATEQYRAALRRYDPSLPAYDVIARERPLESAAATRADAEPSPFAEQRGRPVADRSAGRTAGDGRVERGSRIDFCHAVAGAVFEAIADSPHDHLERAIMDAYFDLAERIEGTDELCLCLLESMAAELETALDPHSQQDLLLAAARRLPTVASRSDETGDALESTLARLVAVEFLQGYAVRSRAVDPDTGGRSWTVVLDEYALGDPDPTGAEPEVVVTLPLSLELFRHCPTRSLAVTDAGHVGSERPAHRVTISTEPTDRASGLVHASEVTRP